MFWGIFQIVEPFSDFIFFQPCLFISLWTVTGPLRNDRGGTEKNGFNCGGWNSAMIADMIFSRFGVNFNPRYLCALLGKLGLSFQKAKFVSDKVGEEEYERNRSEWKKVTWPSILKAAKEKNAVWI